MGRFGGYYKGEKKKGKKQQKVSSIGISPTFTLPEIISRKRKNE